MRRVVVIPYPLKCTVRCLGRIQVIVLAAVLAIFGHPGAADTFLGRQIEITDGRSETGTRAPLVIVLHGFLGRGASMRRKTGFDGLAAQHGFIVVYPDGVRRRWNDGRGAGDRVDDIGYLSKLIRTFVASGQADPTRIFLVGHSNGGGMAMRMACERAEMIRGIVVVATKSPLKGRCRNGKPVPAMFIHGTKDPISPHKGRAGASRLGGAYSSARTLQFWQDRNRCKGVAETRTIDNADDGTTAQYVRYADCVAGLIYVQINGHGHDWPGPLGRSDFVQGAATQEVDAAAISWWFFNSL